MKKIILLSISFLILFSNIVFADDSQLLTDKISDIWLSPTQDAEVLENIKKVNQEKKERDIAQYLMAPGYAREKIGISSDDDIMRQQVEEGYRVKDNEILKMYYLGKNVYAKEYADNNSFRYLISDDYYWIMKLRSDYQAYTAEGEWYNSNVINNTIIGLCGITDDGVSFLKDNEKIQKILKDINLSRIRDIRFLALNSYCTCLYIDSGEKEYLIRVYEGFYRDSKNITKIQDHNSNWTKNLEMYKLYEAKELFNIISEDTNEMNIHKPTYDAEAESLQNEGLLQGNENGLDLLKPLTRIEAATMLLRAMNQSTDTENDEQTFSDVPPEHWGFGAANKAERLGLVRGVGDGKFAPEEKVTAPQFSTMVLRASDQQDFDWEQALNLLVDGGIITEENARTMDFFTRGDMTKIIYEARQKGLF